MEFPLSLLLKHNLHILLFHDVTLMSRRSLYFALSKKSDTLIKFEAATRLVRKISDTVTTLVIATGKNIVCPWAIYYVFFVSRHFSDSFIWNQLLTPFIWRRLLTNKGGEGGVIECCVRLQQRLLVWWHLCALRAIALNELIRSSFVPIVVACYVTAAGVYCVTWRVCVLCNSPRFDAPSLITDDNHLLHLLDSTQ